LVPPLAALRVPAMAVPSAAPVQVPPVRHRIVTVCPFATGVELWLNTVEGTGAPVVTANSIQPEELRVSAVPFQIPVATVLEAVGPVEGDGL
jgi:hypothetical protein